MRYVSTRGGRPSSASPMCCSPAWRPTVACTCPSQWPDAARPHRDARLRLDGGRRDGPVRRRRARPGCARSAVPTTRTPTFRHPAVVPLVQIDDRQWLLELFHGPTLAFKDVALQLVGRMFDRVLDAARRADHDRRCHERRHRVGGDRRRQGLRQRRHRDPLSGGSHERGPATPDDDGRQPQRSRRRHRRHVRRLPGPREGDVRRRRVPRRAATVGGQLDQLGAGHGADRLLRHGARVRSPVRSRRPCPTGNFGNVLSGWIARRMGAPIDDFIVASNTNDILTRFVNDGDMSHPRRRADPQPEHGHPGVVELRTPAVRDERARRRPDHASSWPVPRDRHAVDRGRSTRRVHRRLVPGGALRRRRHAGRDRPRLRRHRHPDRPPHGHRHARRPRARRCRSRTSRS